MATTISNRPWMKTPVRFNKTTLYTIGLGFVAGVIEWAGYHLSGQNNWGATLLDEQLAVNTLQLMVMGIMLARLAEVLLKGKKAVPQLDKGTLFLRSCSTQIGLHTSMLVLGFALSALVFGAVHAAWLSFLFSLYLLSCAEVAANRMFEPDDSRCFNFCLSILIALPLSI